MCSILGFGALASTAILVAGSLALGLSLPTLWKAGIKWFKHKLNRDEPKA